MLTIREFDYSDRDFATVAAISNAAWPEDVITAVELQHNYKIQDTDDYRERLMLEKDNTVIGSGGVALMHWLADPDLYAIDWNCHPDVSDSDQGFDRFFRDHLLQKAMAHDPVAIKAFGREDRTVRTTLLEEVGFKQVMRAPVSVLTVADFDFSAYDKLPDHLAQQGVETLSVADLQKRHDDWQTRLHELNLTVMPDVPTPDTYRPQTFEEYCKRFNMPTFDPKAWFVAVHEDRYIGISRLWLSLGNPEKLYTGFTGSLREWRRKGVATALKVRAIDYAHRTGAKIIETDNEETNPMYDLNIQLGFEPYPAYLQFKVAVADLKLKAEKAE